MKITAPRAAEIDFWLLAICFARVLAYANFMVYAACLPVLMDKWHMSASQAGTISSAFMGGYALSLFFFSWLAERFGAKRMFILSINLTALSSLVFAFMAVSYLTGLVFYAIVALTQGGIYTPAIMLFSDRYDSRKRGMAMGYLIASTSVAYACSLLISGLCLHWSGYRLAFWVTGSMPLLGAGLAGYIFKNTPNRIHPRTERLSFFRMLRYNRNAQYLTAGYTSHSWELLGMWSWTPAFFASSLALSGKVIGEAAEVGAYLTAGMHMVGSFASASMGHLSDRLGRRIILIFLAAISTLLSFSFGWLVWCPIQILTILGLLYYFTALGDSPVLSTALTEVVDPGYLGSMLAVRSLLGFGAGAIAPLIFGVVIDLTNPNYSPIKNWGWAFMTLGLGGGMATWCAFRFGDRKG